jgi:aryl-phospho-beta-D-glucosidase BglC (GH1 family)
MGSVLLRGINRSGLEYSEPVDSGFLAAADFTADDVREMITGWHANVIRVPFNQDWCLRGRGSHPAEEYLASLDQIISWSAALGAYTILDLQWLDTDTVYGCTFDGSANHIPPTPNADTIALWTTLAKRYQDEPAVIFDLLNEPHNRLPDDFFPIHLASTGGRIVDCNSSFVGPEEWVPWATRLVAEIRAIRSSGLILVEGVDWGFDLRRIAIEAPNIVYSTHIYANRRREDWWKALGRWREAPVFVGEWGGSENDLEFGRELASAMRELGLGWTAWSWTDYPQLVRPPGAPTYEPTVFGELVRNELQY